MQTPQRWSMLENTLTAAIERKRRRRLEETVNALLLEMEKVSEGEWVRAVKEYRRER
jgi:hypothetical protein